MMVLPQCRGRYSLQSRKGVGGLAGWGEGCGGFTESVTVIVTLTVSMNTTAVV